MNTTTLRMIPLALMLFILGLSPTPAGANLRAPISLDSPSAVLRGDVRGLTVLGEELRLDCGRRVCRVRVAYHLRADSAGSWRLALVLPGPAVVTVSCAGAVQRIASRPTDWKDPRRPSYRHAPAPRMHETPRMHEAGFVLRLPAGESLLELSYRQAWGREERLFRGYFSGWLSARTLRYELWPLRQWRLAPGFGLSFSLQVEGDAAAVVLLRSASEPAGASRNLALPTRRDDGAFILHRLWGRGFPARLEVVAGSREAIATYGVKPPPESHTAGPEEEGP